jgi:hypothetical protein
MVSHNMTLIDAINTRVPLLSEIIPIATDRLSITKAYIGNYIEYIAYVSVQLESMTDMLTLCKRNISMYYDKIKSISALSRKSDADQIQKTLTQGDMYWLAGV